MGGFRPPEMVKRRPVVVLVGKLPYRDRLATVVPLSGTAPFAGCDYQCLITLGQYLPAPFDGQREWWVKADMVATVSFDRLDLFHTARDQNGKRKYLIPRVSEEQFEQIRKTILRALRFPG
jgi:mRNA interferase MazF